MIDEAIATPPILLINEAKAKVIESLHAILWIFSNVQPR